MNGILSHEQLQPLFYSQGADYCCRIQGEIDHPECQTVTYERQQYLKVICISKVAGNKSWKRASRKFLEVLS
ncbi:hypothetical protein EV356DRAFT_509044 [Viridothelium virens]|uniref:Uncharacterized protein n=1 Tax=Viridothelium virens TaxID=1048519 RepID=A0A6A6GXN6_VIRVR|nr:hypothetical protein EV356DRAFT_509044 [Viridothelium virens]